MNKKLKKKKGFTLIELIIVIAILGILALIAIPKFGSAQKDAKIKADVATAKTIADTTAKMVANNQIDVETKKNTDLFNDVEDKMQSGNHTPQALKDKTNASFKVYVDKDGNVRVTASAEGTSTYELYPKQDKGYPDGTPETIQPTAK